MASSFLHSPSLETGILFRPISTSSQSPSPIDSTSSGSLDANSSFLFPLQFSLASHPIIPKLILSQHSFLDRFHTEVICAYCLYDLKTDIKFPVIWLLPP